MKRQLRVANGYIFNVTEPDAPAWGDTGELSHQGLGCPSGKGKTEGTGKEGRGRRRGGQEEEAAGKAEGGREVR